MNEKEQPQESFAEQTIRRYRGADAEERAQKRKRFTGGLFIANIILIIILYAVFSNRNPVEEYHTASFNYGDLQFRLSMTRDRETRDYIFSLTTRPAEGKSATARFVNNMAELAISYGPSVIIKKTLGEHVTSLDMKQGDADVRKTVIERHDLKLFTDAHPEAVVSAKGSLFSGERPYIPLSAEVRIYAERTLGTSMNFKYEVDR